MVLLTNNFAGGSNGTTITTGNSGGASGNAFDIVNNSVTYSNAQSIGGSPLSGNVSTSGLYLAWSSSLTGSSLPQVWMRAYYYISNLTADCQMAQWRWGSGGSGQACELALSSSSQELAISGNSGFLAAGSQAVPIGSWFRVEGYCTGSAASGQVEIKVFHNPGSATPTETIESGTGVNTGGAITQLWFGDAFSSAAPTMYLGGLGASSTGYIGPVLAGGLLMASFP